VANEKNPNERTLLGAEFDMAKKILSIIRNRFPDAKIYYNEGNHEYRLPRYLARNAPELYNVPGMTVRDFLKIETWGIQWIPTEEDVHFGKLSVFHGHEYRGGGLMVARTMLIKAMDNILFGNFHRPQEFIKPTIKDKILGSWSTGCLCDLHPRYLPKNDWVHGFAIVTLSENGNFQIENKKIINGEVY
jgi:hypothetical protein